MSVSLYLVHPFKGTVHPKLISHSFTTHHLNVKRRPWKYFLSRVTVLEFDGRRELHPMSAYGNQGLQWKKTKTNKQKNMSRYCLCGVIHMSGRPSSPNEMAALIPCFQPKHPQTCSHFLCTVASEITLLNRLSISSSEASLYTASLGST